MPLLALLGEDAPSLTATGYAKSGGRPWEASHFLRRMEGQEDGRKGDEREGLRGEEGAL